jgi:hypothetical protein
VLQGRLTKVAALAIAGIVALSACGVDGTERDALRENVIEPGITALNQSEQLACDGDAATIRLAMDAYELFERQPAPDEQALIDGEFLGGESDRWDVVDGRLLAQDPDCGTVLPPEPLPLPEIVTESKPTGEVVTENNPIGLIGVERLLAELTTDDVAELGGSECARQLAVFATGVERYRSESGLMPEAMTQLEEGDFFVEPITLWRFSETEEQLVPADGSPCLALEGP